MTGRHEVSDGDGFENRVQDMEVIGYRWHNLAYIILDGVPLEGRVAGTARFASGTTDVRVDLSDGLACTV